MYNQEVNEIEQQYQWVQKKKKKNSYCLQRTLGFNLGDSLLMKVKYSFQHEQSQTIKLNGALTWQNGHFLRVSNHLIKLVVDTLNYYNKSYPYSYYDQNGVISFLFKLRLHFSMLHSNQQIIYKYLSRQISSINHHIKYALIKYGVINFNSLSMNKEIPKHLFSYTNQCALRALNLKMKSKIIGIMNEFLLIKKSKCSQNLDQKTGRQKQQNQIESLEGIVKEQNNQGVTCKYYNKIQSKYWSPQVGNTMHDPIFSVHSNRFNICKSQFELTGDGDEPQTKSLIIKEIKGNKIYSQAEQKNYNKAKLQIQREIKIVQALKYNSNYFIKYYFQNKSNQALYLLMEYVPANLSFFVQNDIFTMENSLKRFIEILNGVSFLHLSGVVHRDLKPSNILISDQTIIQNFYQLSHYKQGVCTKIIDFSDSSLIFQSKASHLNKNLGSSLPYSPFQCSFECDFGINNPQIDLWSLGVILYELIYKDIPCIYYRSTKIPELAQSIQKNEFSVRLNNLWHRKTYPNSIDQLMNMVIKNCLQLRQIDRMELVMIKKSTQSILQMITQIQKHIKQRRY